MSLSEKSRHINKIFGTVKIYNKSAGTWTYIATPEVGDIKQSAYSNDHNGWLICDGRSLSRTTHAYLFSIINTKFGSVDGNTFNLPDARGRVLGTTSAARLLGTSIGAETHTLITAEMPSHIHTITDPGHAHSYVNNSNDQSVTDLSGSSAADNADLTQTTGSSFTGITETNAAGGGGAHNNMQPTIFIGNTFIFSVEQTLYENQ